VDGGPDGTVRFTSMTAVFATASDGVMASLQVAASQTHLGVTGAAFVPDSELDIGPGDQPAEIEGEDGGPVSDAASAFDYTSALAELAAQCVIRRFPAGVRIPATVTIGSGPVITTDTLQKIAGSKALRPTSDEIFRQTDELIREFDRTPTRKGLPAAVAQRLGVTIRTAHRYIAAVRAEKEGKQ
jgi:hypothetical protein